MKIIKLIILYNLSLSLHAGELYRFDYYDVHVEVLHQIGKSEVESDDVGYELFGLSYGFTNDKKDLITAFLFKSKLNYANSYEYTCVKINSSGNIIELRKNIKPIFNNKNKPSESCLIYENSTTINPNKNLYHVSYWAVIEKIDELLYQERSESTLSPNTRTNLYPFALRVDGKPVLFISAYYQYESKGSKVFACQIIDENGKLISFLEHIPAIKEKGFFPGTDNYKPSKRCRVS
ncbi:hypothetical protein [Endozoicomonas sp. 8E]|uniref:hypothetical protein n=1 Tax=Endozoicomonas sp. 8E TaxID=3035692 RepID=UPI00293902CD|nr:hypothetical protein [Endozoicomonas sp. 8E]WOG25905.1 hypothetical protein P6910_15140 [Endozoicomonas sp. 8E]